MRNRRPRGSTATVGDGCAAGHNHSEGAAWKLEKLGYGEHGRHGRGTRGGSRPLQIPPHRCASDPSNRNACRLLALTTSVSFKAVRFSKGRITIRAPSESGV